MPSRETVFGVSPIRSIAREKNPAQAVVRDFRGRREADSSGMGRTQQHAGSPRKCPIDADGRSHHFLRMSAALKIQAPPAAKMTWAEYRKLTTTSETRLEFVNGEVYSMAGGTINHNRIAGNVFGQLLNALSGKPCEPLMTDVLLRIELGLDEIGYYPDVMVVCDDKDDHELFCTSPKVIFEVLSQSTRRIDAGEKFLAYKAVPSLEVYVLLEQSFKRAIIHRRSNNWWPEIIEGDGAVLTLDEIGVKLSLADIYARVNWSKQDPGPA